MPRRLKICICVLVAAWLHFGDWWADCALSFLDMISIKPMCGHHQSRVSLEGLFPTRMGEEWEIGWCSNRISDWNKRSWHGYWPNLLLGLRISKTGWRLSHTEILQRHNKVSLLMKTSRSTVEGLENEFASISSTRSSTWLWYVWVMEGMESSELLAPKPGGCPEIDLRGMYEVDLKWYLETPLT